MTATQFFTAIAISATTAVGSVLGFQAYTQDQPLVADQPVSSGVFKQAKFSKDAATPTGDFEKAATKAAPAVVHIKVSSRPKQVTQRGPNLQGHPFEEYFGDMFGQQRQSAPTPQRKGSGSGVLISADGYIVTNNHVVDGSDEITITLENKKDYKAKLVGKDPSSDLAVVKIDATNLPFLTFANSDNVRLGQWVLAIGYPLGMETTITSGIISAKSRNLGINSRQSSSPVEAFLQTDAAVNPGNSGGALVDTNGDVIGINSAIASPTGSYAGYSYAIPSNMVKKIVADIIEYGSTKRAYLGVMFGSDRMTEEERRENNVKEGVGVYVMEVAEGGAAQQAGLQKGDFITKLNGITINTGTEIIERISALRPGDKVSITYNRNGSEKTTAATLKGDAASYSINKEKVVNNLGATFEDLDKSKAASLQIHSGVVVKRLGQGILAEQTRIKEGFIITKVNNTRVSNVDELQQAIQNAGNSAIISGVYPNQPGRAYQYAINDLQ